VTEKCILCTFKITIIHHEVVIVDLKRTWRRRQKKKFQVSGRKVPRGHPMQACGTIGLAAQLRSLQLAVVAHAYLRGKRETRFAKFVVAACLMHVLLKPSRAAEVSDSEQQMELFFFSSRTV
jgi:hypothetical protein